MQCQTCQVRFFLGLGCTSVRFSEDVIDFENSNCVGIYDEAIQSHLSIKFQNSSRIFHKIRKYVLSVIFALKVLIHSQRNLRCCKRSMVTSSSQVCDCTVIDVFVFDIFDQGL